MKKVLKLISIFILLLIINVGVVRAANKCGNVTISSNTKTQTNNSFGGFPLYSYNFKINNSTTAVAYCHNPGIYDYVGSDIANSQKVTMNCGSLIFDANDNSKLNQIFGVGLMVILNSNESYNVKYMAENMYEMLFPSKNTKSSQNTKQTKFLKYYVNKNITDLKNELSKIKGVTTITKKLSNASSSACKGSNCESQDDITAAIDLVKKGIKAAALYSKKSNIIDTPVVGANSPIHQRTEDKSKNEKIDSVSYTINITDFPEYSKNKNTSVNLEFKCNNCNNVKNTKIYLSNKQNDKSKELSANDLKNINLLKDYAENGNGKVYLTIDFISNKDTCGDVSYTLNATYKYNSSSLISDKDLISSDKKLVDEILKALGNTGYEVSACSTSHNACQGFYVIQKNSGSGNNTNGSGSGAGNSNNAAVNNSNNIEKNLSFSNTISLCGNGDTVVVNKEVCTPKINNVDCVECQKNTHKININEGYTYSNNNTCDTSGETLNVDKCIIENKDIKGNNYKNTVLSNIAKNGGASVYCKEDYSLTLPGSKETESGISLALDPTKIHGSKHCYSSEYNSVESLKNKIEQESLQLVQAFNNLAHESAILYCLTTEDKSNCEYKPYNGKGWKTESCTWIEPKVTCKDTYKEVNYTSCKKINGHTGYPTGSETCVSCPYDSSKNCVYTGQNCEKDEIEHTDGVKYVYGGDFYAKYNYYIGCGDRVVSATAGYNLRYESETCHTPTDAQAEAYEVSKYGKWTDTVTEELKAKIGAPSNISCKTVGDLSKGGGIRICSGTSGSGLIGDVEQYENNIQSEIDIWNNSFDWNMDYNFNPTLRFWYQEEYMNMPGVKDTMNEIETYSKNEKGKILYCTGYVSNDYEHCYSDANKTNEIKWTDDKSKITTTANFCICSEENGCSKVNKTLYNARYAKQEATVDRTYQIPTQFYSLHPSGNIVVSNSGNSAIENSTELKNSLPVSLKTIGTRRYIIWVEDLGEYYETNTLGRIWGTSNSVLPALLSINEESKCNSTSSALLNEDNTNGVIHSNGVYACKYTTNCPDPPTTGNPPGDPDNYTCINPKIENGKYSYCDNLPQGSKNATYLCRENVNISQYKTDCPGSIVGDPGTCTNPKIENGKYSYCDKLPLGSANATYLCHENEDISQYKVDCPETPPGTPTGGDPNNYKCTNPKVENGKYSYCDNLPQGSKNATYLCRENVNISQYKTDCPDSGGDPDNYKCTNPKVENGKYSYCDNLPQGSKNATYLCRENVNISQYKTDCPESGGDPDDYTCTNPKIENGKYSYCDSLPLGGTNATYKCREDYSYDQYKTDCCPGGKCPPTINYKCAVTTKEDDPNKLIYYDKYGNETTEDVYNAQCNSDPDNPNCPDCPPTCTFCLYDGKKLNIQYRAITSEDLNPNDRNIGINWQWDNNIDTTLELKAYVTTDEIEKAGDDIFDIEDNQYDNRTTGNETFAMKVKMDGKLITKLRNINKSLGFGNNTLKCYDYLDANGNAIYKNIYCYSTIIDNLLEEGYDIDFTVTRPKDSERKSQGTNENYFTNFASKTATQWRLDTGMNLAIATTNRDKYGIEINRTTGSLTDYHVGPSWK